MSPGGFLQLTDSPQQSMAWTYATRLYNAELNARWNPRCNLTMLAGFRWVNLSESLVGTLTPLSFPTEPPFWNTMTTNNLYGFQIGTDGKIFERGRFSIGGLAKAGIFDNNADESTGVSTEKQVRPSSASTNHAAFVGETGLQCRYQVTERLTLKAGYQAIWLEGVALAPGQIQETYLTSPTTVQAVGVNCNGGVFYHAPLPAWSMRFRSRIDVRRDHKYQRARPLDRGLAVVISDRPGAMVITYKKQSLSARRSEGFTRSSPRRRARSRYRSCRTMPRKPRGGQFP